VSAGIKAGLIFVRAGKVATVFSEPTPWFGQKVSFLPYFPIDLVKQL
jgi:hypothetical protein